MAPLIYNDGFAIVPPQDRPHWPQRDFLRRLLRRLEIDCVIDVGANTGDYAAELRMIGFSGTILSFEPDPSCFAVLTERSRGDAKWRIFNMALGREKASAELNIMAAPVFNSFLDPSTDETESFGDLNHVVDRISVPVERLDTVFPGLEREHGLGSVFLKMDTQGFDLEVFHGALGILPSLRGLQSELSVKRLYRSTGQWWEVIQEYEAAGFELADLKAVNAHLEELVESDCYMVRRAAR
jgi:FkbM family methyltransferase